MALSQTLTTLDQTLDGGFCFVRRETTDCHAGYELVLVRVETRAGLSDSTRGDNHPMV